MILRRELEERFTAALAAASALEAPPPDELAAGRPGRVPPGTARFPALVAPSSRREFGDYQVNGVMPAAKALKANPRKLAEKVASLADVSEMAEKVEVAGPGFINVTLRADWLAEHVIAFHMGWRLAGRPLSPDQVRTVVVDYSAPNLAKEMHVGHLRSTIIGDALARVLDFIGHKVIRQNHVGDWGTQFGMLAALLERRTTILSNRPGAQVLTYRLSDLEEFYAEAQELFQTDESFAQVARQYVVRLQKGDLGALSAWGSYRNVSLVHCQRVYSRLGVRLSLEDARGESAYNDDLPKVVADLEAKGLLRESEGAKCVFLDEFTGKDGEPLPLIVQKSDEGYLYATTDLAAIRYRVNELKADRVLYVVDARQSLHFRMVFAVARKAGFAPESVSLEHVAFGTMMAPDGTPFKTREGGTVKLMDLLDQAVQKARALVDRKNPDLTVADRAQIAEAVGIGAVKYADLAQNRLSDYVFSFDKMLSLEGNTAPYMQYAYARIRSIFRKAGDEPFDPSAATIALAEPAERALALRLLQFPETVQAVAEECLPHLLCGYLYDLASAFTTFYETCPVLKSPKGVRASRLALCRLAENVIATGLDLLGIETIEQM